MKILKNSENYTINGTLENGWEVNGNMSASTDNTSINFSVSKKAEASEDIMSTFSEVGSYYWNKSERISANYSIANAADESEFIENCLSVVADALKVIKD